MGPLTEEIFIQRTKEIILQYKIARAGSKADYYDVTLLFNCLLGLIIMPRNHLSFKMINGPQDRPLSSEVKNTIASAADKQKNNIDIQFIEYIIGLRNAISHQSLENKSLFSTNAAGTISCIRMTGSTSPIVNGKKAKHIINYEFDVGEENQLMKVVNEILDFIYPENASGHSVR